MAFDLGSIFASVGVDISNLDKGLMQAQVKLAAADKTITGYGQKLTAASTKMMISGGLMVGAVAGVAIAAVKMASEFETSMRNVNSISKLSEGEFKKLGESVVGISKKFPQSAKELADGLYDIASSGFQGAAGLKVLEASASAASAGLTNTATSAKGITAVLNAYGLEAEDAAAISDTMFKTVDKGVITFEELSSTVGDWVGMSKAANISFNEASGAIAYMTTKGIDASEAGVSLQRMLTGIIKPSEDMAKFIHNAGYESGEMMLKTLGLTGTMKLLNDETGGSITKMIDLIPEIRGVRGANALLGAGYEELTGFMADFKDTTGATAIALKEQSKSLSFQLNILKNNGTALAIELGNKLIPSIAGIVKGLNDLKPETKDTIFLFGELLLGAVGSVGGLLLLAGAAGKVRLAVIGLNTSMVTFAATGSAFSKFAGSMASFLAVFGAQTPAIGAFIDDMGLLKNASGDLQVVANNMKGAMLANQASFDSSVASNRQSITNIQDLLKTFNEATPATIAKILELNTAYNDGFITIGQFNDKLYDLTLTMETSATADAKKKYFADLTTEAMKAQGATTAEITAALQGETAATDGASTATDNLYSSLFSFFLLSADGETKIRALNDAYAAYTQAVKDNGAASDEAKTAKEEWIRQLDTEIGATLPAIIAKTGEMTLSDRELLYAMQDNIDKAQEAGVITRAQAEETANTIQSTIDNTFIPALARGAQTLTELGNIVAEPEVKVDISDVTSKIGHVASMLSDINGRVATTYIDTVSRKIYSMGGIVGMASGGVVLPQAASGMVVPQTGRAIPILAHEYEDIVNTSQQRNLAEWIMGKANSRPDGKSTSNEVILHTIINLDGQVLWENNEKFDLRKLGERV